MSDVVEWVKKNAMISHDDGNLVCGRIGSKRFRIFVKEGWVGVIGDKGNWGKSKSYYNLNDFLHGIRYGR